MLKSVEKWGRRCRKGVEKMEEKISEINLEKRKLVLYKRIREKIKG